MVGVAITSFMQNTCLNKMSLISWLWGANSTSTFLPEENYGATKAANVFVKAAVSSHDRKGRKRGHYNHYDADIRAKSSETCPEAVVLTCYYKKERHVSANLNGHQIELQSQTLNIMDANINGFTVHYC